MTWESGYGDYLARPDWSTLRVIPWLEKTALVLGDAVDEATGDLVSDRPPLRPAPPDRAVRERWAFTRRWRAELEFYLLRETYEEAQAKGFEGLHPFGWYNEDYQLLQATKARTDLPPVPQPDDRGRGADRVLQGRSRRRASTKSTSTTPMRWKRPTAPRSQARRQGDRPPARPRHHLHGQAGPHLDGLQRPHPPQPLGFAEGEERSSRSVGAGEMSDTMRQFLGGLMAGARELSLFVAPNVNSYKRYAVASWAPVNIVWARDNRTCGFRIVGHGNGLRIENRFPGGDANPYLAYAALLAAGLHGIERGLEPEPEFRGNAYEANDVPHVPRSLAEAITTWCQSDLARRAFGDDVWAHYLNMAEVEQRAFNAAVTDWERRRYFERG